MLSPDSDDQGADLALALEVVAGPDEAREGVGYRLAPPPKHAKLNEYRVLVMSTASTAADGV